MGDIGSRLKDADPVHREAGLTAAELRVMRKTVVAAGRQSGTRRVIWERLLIASAVALTLAAAITIDRRHTGTNQAEHEAASGASRRQLQFATPGGTRVIWVFDSKFEP